jgi:hypothetical protein
MKPSAEAKEAIRKKRALECRTIRLYISAHPGSTSFEIAKGTGIRGEHLYRMLGMKLIRFTQQPEGNRRPQRWYVVPQ